MLNKLSPKTILLIIGLIAAATLLGAFIFEYFGFPPCELCLLQRWPYYLGLVVAALGLLISQSNPKLASVFLLGLAAVFLFSAGFGIYHAGVEWKFWAGPDTCTGGGDFSGGLPDLTKPGVMCDEPALRILGISLAGWNAVISAGMSLFSFRAARKPTYGSSSVSQ
jgi:disulfide bond formation protein DsbB